MNLATKDKEDDAAKSRPNCAKRLECVELAPAIAGCGGENKNLLFFGKAGVVFALVATFLALWPSQVIAEDLSSAFQSANKLYEENKFAEAASGYQKLTESGRASAALWFNLGNALFKSGQIGRAIVAY